jgi:hypothetical protein
MRRRFLHSRRCSADGGPLEAHRQGRVALRKEVEVPISPMDVEQPERAMQAEGMHQPSVLQQVLHESQGTYGFLPLECASSHSPQA